MLHFANSPSASFEGADEDRRLVAGPLWIARAAGFVTATAGALVLVGWARGSEK